jgi:hypothetical protein
MEPQNGAEKRTRRKTAAGRKPTWQHLAAFVKFHKENIFRLFYKTNKLFLFFRKNNIAT